MEPPTTKRCAKCGENQPIHKFYTQTIRNRTYLGSYCTPCLRKTEQIKREQVRHYLRELKSEMGCRECGYRVADALEWHHRDPQTKIYNIAAIAAQTVSYDRIRAEIAKCDVLCSNCHRALHQAARQRSLEQRR